MAEGGKGPVEDVITFDLLGNLDDSNQNFFTDEEEEIAKVVTLIEGADYQDLDDFELPKTRPHHSTVSETELDQLASKNNATTTTYQTKWAVSVMRGTIFYIILSYIA